MRNPILVIAIALVLAAPSTALAKDVKPRDAQSGHPTGKRTHTSTSKSKDTHPSPPPPNSGWDLKENKKL